MLLGLGDLPSWFAAVGTVGALGAALFQIKTDRDRQHAREHVAQAQRISAFIEGPVREPHASGDPPPTASGALLDLWADKGSTALTVINASVEPVYTVILGIVWTQRGGFMPDTLEKLVEKRKGMAVGIVRILPGGTFRAWVPYVYDPVVLYGTEIAFTDRNGSHWIRRWNGLLEELDVPPLKHLDSFGLKSPYFMQMPERIT